MSASFTIIPTLSFNETFRHGLWKKCDSISKYGDNMKSSCSVYHAIGGSLSCFESLKVPPRVKTISTHSLSSASRPDAFNI